MQEYKRRKKGLADKNTAAAAGAGCADDPQPGPPATFADGNSGSAKVAPEAAARSRSDEKDVFYERLQKLNEPSGLSLIILHQFEQMHHYRTPRKAASPSSQQGPSVVSADSPNGLRGTKRHYDERSSPSLLICSNIQDTPNTKRTFTPDNYQLSKGPKTPELKPILQTSTNDKELKKERCGLEAPVKARTAYQLYLKLECDRFKNAHGDNSVNQKVRDEIIDTWRHLSESDRKPYVDASNKDKERYNLQMAVYKEHKSKSSNQSLSHVSTQSLSLFHISSQSEAKSHQSWFSSSAPSVINFGSSSSSSQTYDDYYVTLQGDDGGNELAPPDKSLVDSTIEMLKGARPGDPIFQVDWDYSF
nr:putative high mobility group B protein 11 isoform X2 [Ipomoea batatas]